MLHSCCGLPPSDCVFFFFFFKSYFDQSMLNTCCCHYFFLSYLCASMNISSIYCNPDWLFMYVYYLCIYKLIVLYPPSDHSTIWSSLSSSSPALQADTEVYCSSSQKQVEILLSSWLVRQCPELSSFHPTPAASHCWLTVVGWRLLLCLFIKTAEDKLKKRC